MARQLEAESDRKRQMAFIGALRSLAVHGRLLIQQLDTALRSVEGEPVPPVHSPGLPRVY